jgi:ABC-type branched-subunit amino acid transport system substrate-binding protein
MINPYNIGNPIVNPQAFFGRQSLFEFIQDNLVQKTPVILLYGQRRIGKSSILTQIPHRINDPQFVFVNFDCQRFVPDRNARLKVHEVLNFLARAILETIGDEDSTAISSCMGRIAEDINIFHRQFLREVYAQLGDRKLVLLLDEFDVVGEADTDTESGNIAFFQLINQWSLTSGEQLFVVPVVGQHIRQLPKLLELRGGLPYKEIALLDPDSAERLIIRPAQGALTYTQESINTIYSLSAGHPYFTQVICYALFQLALEEGEPHITPLKVENIINQAIELGEGGLIWFWDGLDPEAQVIFSAAAETQLRLERGEIISDDPLSLLRSYGISTGSLTSKVTELVEYGFLDDTQRRVKVQFVRRWLLQRHRLKDEIINLEKVHEKDIESIRSIANSHPGTALELYQQALEINPNNFIIVTSLAQKHLQLGNLQEAFQLYDRANKFYDFHNSIHRERLILEPLWHSARQQIDLDQSLLILEKAYKFDASQTSKELLIIALELKGHNLIINQDFPQAQEQFERVLTIDPARIISRERLAEITAFIEVAPDRTEIQSLTSTTVPEFIKPIAFVGILAAISILGIGVYTQISKPCGLGEKKEFGVFCVSDSTISSGGKAFPFNNRPNNTYRDQGVKAFKQGKYQEASELFKKSLGEYRNDPEVLIYKNNAQARLQPYPFKIAVVVPITPDSSSRAEEILRGVAQSQEKFAQNRGLNGRLLEVVIANDSNDPQQAEKVANELVADPSILAVIGHSTSDLTRAVLPIYERAKLAIISSTATSTLLDGNAFFRAVYSDEIGGKNLAEYTYRNLKLKTAVIFANPNSHYSNSLREAFTRNFEKLGGSVVRYPLIDLTNPLLDIRREISTTVYNKANQAEAVMLFPDTKHTDIAIGIAEEITRRNNIIRKNSQTRQFKQLTMLGGDSLYKPATAEGKNINGLILSVPWFRGTEEAKAFADNSRNQWGAEISWRTATTFDAARALIQSLSGSASRNSVLRKLANANLPKNETSGYPLQFSEDKERLGKAFLVTVKDGRFKPVDNGL